MRVATGEEELCVSRKPGHTQQLPQEGCEDEISDVPTCPFAEGERVRKAPPSPEITELPEMTLLGEQRKKRGRETICSSCD